MAESTCSATHMCETSEAESPHTHTDRFVLQAELIPRERLKAANVTVIGVGAIGRQVALQLACLGVARLQLVDFDVVEPTNVTLQGYTVADIGQPKVLATAGALGMIEPSLAVTLVDSRYRPKLAIGEVVFCCVDSISARTAIWRAGGKGARFWCDGRMLGEVLRVLVAADEGSRAHYPTTLFAQHEAESGSCTARGTVYTAQIAAGLMLHQFTRWLRDLPIERDATLNLLAGELNTHEAVES